MTKNNPGQSATGEHPVLVALQGPLEGGRWMIIEPIVIGRETDCSILIEDRQVSRHHARVTVENGHCLLEDLGSKNGTYHKGKALDSPVQLVDGDVIQIALIQKFGFYSSDATMPMEDLDPAFFNQPGKLKLDAKSRRVWIGSRELDPPLSAAQFRLLLCLYVQSGKVISRNEMIQCTWGEEETVGVSEQALDALIRRLRDRLAELNPSHPYIVTVRGHGARLDNL